MTQTWVPQVSTLRPGTAADIFLAGLIDYAGLYAPANLDMHSAVQSYLRYRQGRHEHALGRFIVDLSRAAELLAAAGDDLADLKVSLIAPSNPDWGQVSSLLSAGLPIQAIEFKYTSLVDFKNLIPNVPRGVEAYVEVPFAAPDAAVLSAIADAGARVKLRMGGVVAEAFPSPRSVALMLVELARRRMPFKATAGLHHAIRSRHHFTYEYDSPAGLMHGFINLLCAAALVHFGGEAAEATRILEEQDPHAWRLTPGAIAWHFHHWTAGQLSEVRQRFISFGSCSFEEPIRDLEIMGWL